MSDIREALSQAFDGAETEPEQAAEPRQEAQSVVPDAAAVPAESAPTLADRPAETTTEGRDASGRFAAKAKATEAAKVAPAATEPTKAATAEATTAPPPAPDAVRAPQSWTPAARERFAALPPEVRQEVMRREKDMTVALQESAGARKFASEFQQVVAPFEGMLRAEGAEPLKAVGELLKTAAALRTAPPAHKAQLVAQLVKSYGIPIDALDAALSGQAIPQGQGQQQGQYFDPRVDQLFSSLEEAKSRRSQAEQRGYRAEVETLAAKSEFFEDVRETVAEVLEVNARRGVAMTLEQAYNRAVQMHPEISEVLRQREGAKSAANAQASTQRARDAASSVRSQPSGPQSAAKPEGLRAELEAAMAAHSVR